MITAVYINNKIKTLILIILILCLIYATNKIKKYFKLSKIKLLFTNKNFRQYYEKYKKYSIHKVKSNLALKKYNKEKYNNIIQN